MLHASGVYYIAIWSQGLILNLGRSYAIFGTKISVLELIQGLFWVQNGKNDGFTKMSVGSWKSYIVQFLWRNFFLNAKFFFVELTCINFQINNLTWYLHARQAIFHNIVGNYYFEPSNFREIIFTKYIAKLVSKGRFC